MKFLGLGYVSLKNEKEANSNNKERLGTESKPEVVQKSSSKGGRDRFEPLTVKALEGLNEAEAEIVRKIKSMLETNR